MKFLTHNDKENSTNQLKKNKKQTKMNLINEVTHANLNTEKTSVSTVTFLYLHEYVCAYTYICSHISVYP